MDVMGPKSAASPMVGLTLHVSPVFLLLPAMRVSRSASQQVLMDAADFLGFSDGRVCLIALGTLYCLAEIQQRYNGTFLALVPRFLRHRRCLWTPALPVKHSAVCSMRCQNLLQAPLAQK